MKEKRKAPPPKSGGRKLSGAAMVAAALPLAVSLLPAVLNSSTLNSSTRAPAKPQSQSAPKKFTIPVSNLRDWASRVIVTINDMRIEGHSKVHALASDCELHFGAHSNTFQGEPSGLVLEPMNVCVQPFPGKTDQNNKDWIDFSEKIKNTTVTVSGVPRIWPEHLEGGNEPSNPNHAVEIHPLTSVVSGNETLDFAPNIFAGEFTGGVKEETAAKIAQNTSVTVTRIGDSAEINFSAGTIGNFTVVDLVINRNSIAGDGAGSLRMEGEVVIDDGTQVPVHLVTALGSPINDTILKVKAKQTQNIQMTALVLFSLSPKALLDAASQSQGGPVKVVTPLQLILYGPPEDS